MPKVSIILAVYNVEKYLRQSLDSLVNQTLQDIEIICVNDGSTDGSLDILNEYAAKDNRFVVISQENQGPGAARNRAIEKTTGDYLMILDPDDWYESNACEIAYNQIVKNNNDMVFFGLQRYYEETGKTIVDTGKLKPFSEVIDNPQINLAKLCCYYLRTAYTWSQIYSTKFIKENNIRYSTSHLGEDLVFIIKAVVLADTISVLNMPIYNYRIRKNSLSTSLGRYWQDLIHNRKIALDIVQKSENEMDYVYAYLIYLINSTYYWYEQISMSFPKLKKQYYMEMRNIYRGVNKRYNIKKIKNNINYKKFKKICSKSYIFYNIEPLLKNILEVKNSEKHKVITLLGIKIKIRKV